MLTSIKSVGSHVPSGILTNADLEKMVDTSDTWIRERTGIHERRIAAVDETATDLAAEAAKDALLAGGFRPDDTDLIVCSTSTPDSMYPSVASRVQERLQAHGPAFDVQPAGRRRSRRATEILAQATMQALEEAHVRLEDVRLSVPRQANARIIEAAAKRLGVGPDVMVNNIANYGNTSTASIPLALKDAVGAGRLKSGDHLVLVGFGAGLTWGACVITWEGAPVRAAA